MLALGSRRGTFLPAVWQSLPEPERFVWELRRKAEIPANGWREGLCAYRYSVQSASGPLRPPAQREVSSIDSPLMSGSTRQRL